MELILNLLLINYFRRNSYFCLLGIYKLYPIMKRSLCLALLIFFITVNVNGQDYKTSLGLRAGIPFGPSGVTLKHFLNKATAVEGILAMNYGTGITATCMYEKEHWTGKYPGFNWFWGLGAHAGFMDAGATRWVPASFSGGGVLGIDGVAGLEYTFDEIPLNVSLDILPSLNLIGYFGVNSISSGISIRYVF
jgi:hypothetical protein